MTTVGNEPVIDCSRSQPRSFYAIGDEAVPTTPIEVRLHAYNVEIVVLTLKAVLVFAPRKSWMLSGPRHRGLTIMRKLFTCSLTGNKEGQMSHPPGF